MKSKSLCSVLALIFSVSMLVFTFFTCGWFYLDNQFDEGVASENALPITLENSNGFQMGFEFPIGTKGGFFSTLSDCIWAIAPFLVLTAVCLITVFQEEKITKIGFFLAGLPAVLYPISQGLLFLGGKDVHFSFLITLFFFLATGGLTLFAIFHPELKKFAWQVALLHGAIEIFLLVLSLIFREKYSFFYFSQYLRNGTLWSRFHYFILSVFIYYLSYSLVIVFLHLSQTAKDPEPLPGDENILPIVDEKTQNTEEENEDEEEISLSLEDLGIER